MILNFTHKIPNLLKVSLCFLVFILISFNTNAQVTSAIDSSSIKIGEEIRYKIKVEADSTNIIVFPEGQTFLPMEVIESYDIDTLRKRNKFRLIKEYGLTQFDSGRYLIPSQKVVVGDKVFATDSLVVEVRSIEVDTTKQGLYDIKPIIEVEKSTSKWWLYLLIALILIGLIGTALYWFIWRKKPLTEEEKIALLPPYDRAKLALKKLDESGYLEKSELKEYYSELTFAIRRYIDEKVYDHSLESTTDELIFRLNLLRQANKIDLSQETIKNLESILKRADLVKFAKSTPDKELAIMDRQTVDIEIDHVKESLPEASEEEKLLDEKYRIEKKRKEQRRKVILTSVIVLALLIMTYVGFGLKYGFTYVKDTIVGHDSKELLEGNWVKSAYGVPPIYISTPEVLERVEIPNKEELSELMNVSSFGFELKDNFTIALSTTTFKEAQEDIDARNFVEETLKYLEKNGASNIITKTEKFVTPNAAEGLKTFGNLAYTKPGGDSKVGGEYVILTFIAEKTIVQQILITYLEDDVYADDIVERILNSIELKKEVDAERD